MNAITIATLVLGLLCLVIGWITSRNASQSNVVVSCLLLGMGTAFLTFALFPGSTADGAVMGFKVTGALGGLLIVWMFGLRQMRKGIKLDDLLSEIERLRKECRRPQRIKSTDRYLYALANGKHVGLVTGDIKDVHDIDIWVNSENTDMEMARFSDLSVSSTIRYYGAKRDHVGDMNKPEDDLIANALKVAKGTKPTVQPATVLATTAGELEQSNGVKRIFHVAAVQGPKAAGYQPVSNLDDCVRKVLAEATKVENQNCSSILLPLMATGTAKGDPRVITKLLFETAVSYLETHNQHPIQTLWFVAYSDLDLEICQSVLTGLKNRLTPC